MQEALAIARTESALFQERWTEAELRTKALGVDVSEADDRQWQRTVVESVRALYHAEDEKQLCMEQLERVLKAVDRDDVEQLSVVLNDAEAILLNQGLNQQLGSKTQTVPAPEATLGQARVMDVNATLGVVVLNIGRQQGTRVGMPFMVLDGDNVIAYLRVIEVRRRIAGAIIEDRIADAEITPGQAVRVSER